MLKMKTLLAATSLLLHGSLWAQSINRTIKAKQVARIERKLSSDAMEGRATFSAGIDKAANYISQHFASLGLGTFKNSGSYLQPFTMIKGTITSASGQVGGQPVSAEQLLFISTNPSINISNDGNYKVVRVKAGDNMMQSARPYLRSKQNTLLLVDTSFAPSFKQLRRFLGPNFPQANNVVLVLTGNTQAETFNISISQRLEEQRLANVVAVLPGKGKAHEFVIFSGHYDHLGFEQPNAAGDSLYNGANDDAAGTTAVMMLAKHFKKLNNNERTLVFAAFTAEEIGLFGSTYFSSQFNPDSVAAMFNIEMIGTESKWGANSAYITGYEKSDLGKILEKNLEGSGFKFYPDPYPQQQLFYRSDNATLARLGVPAHTISTSKMDSEKYYHTPDDEFETLNMKNMTAIIKAIAISSASIVAGNDTPTRVASGQMRQ
jgi:hypothetical protein